MTIKIDEINNKIQITLNAEDWFIGEVDDQTYVWKYALSPKIDRSEKGKCPDVGCPKILLDEDEYLKLKGLLDEINWMRLYEKE